MFRVAVLISGRGSNLKALLDAQSQSYHVSLVVSDKDDAPGLAMAARYGVPVKSFPRKRYESKALQKEAIYQAVAAENPDAIALAGFMQILEARFVEHWFGKLINIHPSLLPEFPGLDTHTRALTAKATRHGCTVHYVDTGVDTGPIIAQAACEVLPSDTADTLAERVLCQEHRLYPWVLSQLAGGHIQSRGRSVIISERAREEAASLGFILPPS